MRGLVKRRTAMAALAAGAAMSLCMLGVATAQPGRWGDEAELLKGCQARDVASCELLGLTYVDAGKPAQAHASFVRACETLKGANACNWLAQHHQKRNETDEVRRWSTLGCQLGNQGLCKTMQQFGALDDFNAKQAAAASASAQVDALVKGGDFAGAMELAAYQLKSRADAERVLLAAAEANALGQLADKHYLSLAHNWFQPGRSLQLVQAELVRRGYDRQGNMDRAAPPRASMPASSGSNQPTLADQVNATRERQRLENCAAAAKGANRVCVTR